MAIIVTVILVATSSLYIVSVKLGSIDSSSNSTKLSTTLSFGGGPPSVKIIEDNLTVGFQSGLWIVTMQNTGVTGITTITIYLITPIQSKLCSGTTPDAGLFFANCQFGLAGNPLPPGSLVTGSGTGVGEGSATIGSSYPVGAQLTFTNGTSMWVNSTVMATEPNST